MVSKKWENGSPNTPDKRVYVLISKGHLICEAMEFQRKSSLCTDGFTPERGMIIIGNGFAHDEWPYIKHTGHGRA